MCAVICITLGSCTMDTTVVSQKMTHGQWPYIRLKQAGGLTFKKQYCVLAIGEAMIKLIEHCTVQYKMELIYT